MALLGFAPTFVFREGVTMMADDKRAVREERQALFERIYAFYDVKILAAALEIKIFEHTREPKTAEQLAELTGVPPRVLRSLLVSLLAMKLIEHGEPNGYQASEKAKRYFVEGSPYRMADVVHFAEWQF